MVVLNPNNWHWVDRNTLPWTKKYIEDQFNGWEVEVEDHVFRIVNVGMVSGDSSVSQRKGKVICYFDLNLDFKVSVHGKNEKEGEELCQGTVTVPEFLHDEVEFEINYSGFGDQESVLRQGFVPQLRSELLKYQPRLIEEHSESVQHAA